jgi:succinate dehydrogenase hydrophobic anchor subunit
MAVRPSRPSRLVPADERPSTPGSRSWRFTALTGVAVLALVTVHMVAHHFVVQAVGGLRSYRQVLEYIGNPVIAVIESLFLVVVTWHAMLGLRSVLFDFGLGTRMRRFVNVALVVVGSLTVVYGFVLIVVLALRA